MYLRYTRELIQLVQRKRLFSVDNTSEEITHNKKVKLIDYKNAWLKIYDVPIMYFPKFFHPDPTVKRQSGFLAPTFSDSLAHQVLVLLFLIFTQYQLTRI